MIERILQKLYDEYYPDRDIQVLIVNGRVTLAINDTVYGLNGLLELEDIVKFDKIHFSYDARYQEAVISQEPRVLKMNCKFDRIPN